jgi:hypothetical protein
MAQTGFTPIQLYSTTTAAAVPVAGNLTNSTLGSELAINITDGKLFYKDNANNVQVIGWKVVPATAGGTGQTSYAVGDILYADTTTSLAKLADVATGNALISGGVGVAPSYGKIGLTTHVSGTLPVANGGTGTSTAFTAGSVVFAGVSGVYNQDNANLFWDDTNDLLGIGTPTPAVRFHVSGTSTTAIARIASTNNGTGSFTGAGAGLELTAVGMNETSATFTPAIKFGSTDADFTTTNPKFGAAILAKAAQTYNSDTTGGMDLMFWTSPINPGTGNGLVERARIFASGGVSIGNIIDPGATNLSVTGNVVIATSGKGIDFSATPGTGTSELFADYEEGTWTPTITPSTSGAVTYTTQDGTYTKVGRQVTIVFVVAGTKNTASGEFRIGGIPFNISGSAITGAINWFNPSGTALVNAVAFYFSSTLFRVGVITAANTDATAATFSSAEVSSTFSLTGTLTYFV